MGRHDVLETQFELLDPSHQEATTVVVSAVSGLAGIGKTALALRAADLAHARGWFRGGVLFVNMRGYDPDGQVTADQAVGALLRALGVRDEDLPPTPDERIGLYRSELVRLADAGKRLLLVVDNASTSTQVAPLVPARQEHRLLVTSRDTLTALPARLIELDQLTPGPAVDLIADILTRARPEDTRPTRESDAVAKVAAHCGYLPLALEIAAQILVADPGLPLASLAASLSDTRTRLETLRVDDGGQSLCVRAAFDLSYGRLSTETGPPVPASVPQYRARHGQQCGRRAHRAPGPYSAGGPGAGRSDQ